MIRRPSCAPGPWRPERRRSAPLALATLVVVALISAACGGAPTVTTTPAAPSDPPTVPTSAAPPTPTDAAPPTVTPIEDPEATDAPSVTPAAPPPTDPAPTDPADADVAACTGTPENRDFFAAVADAVAWTVYCPVLPAGWFVDSGQYRLAGGGWLEIAYRGPGGARVELREGSFCDEDDCAPSGTDLGPADFGDRSGTLLDLGAGRYAVVVDAGARPSWVLVTSGLSEAETRAIGSAMVALGGT